MASKIVEMIVHNDLTKVRSNKERTTLYIHHSAITNSLLLTQIKVAKKAVNEDQR